MCVSIVTTTAAATLRCARYLFPLSSSSSAGVVSCSKREKMREKGGRGVAWVDVSIDR